MIKKREVTSDSLFGGRLECYQYKDGYRFSIDSVLLSHFVIPRKNERILDLGAGCGVIGLVLLYRHAGKNIHVTGLEKQKGLVSIARRNIRANGFDHQFHLAEGDVTDINTIFTPESFSLVISNPPFFLKHSGRLSKNMETLTARHQQETTLSGFLQAAASCLKNRGRFIMIYPAGSLSTLFSELNRKKLEPKRARFVYSYPESSYGARLVLIETVKNGGDGLRLEAPLYVYQHKNGPHTDEIMNMYVPNRPENNH